jgi:membrane fusion protein (multidrug efflux system)
MPLLPLRTIVAAVLLAVPLAACKKGESASQGAPGGGGAPPGMPVDVAVARADRVVDAIPATGQVEAVQSIELRPEVEGRIVEILVREGEVVDRDRTLFKVDDAELKAQVARAEADRDLARQALQRTRSLLTQNASSAADLERAEATARSAEASYDLLRIRLDRTLVRAPFAGVVGRRLVSLGDFVNNSTRLTTLQTISPQRVAFNVPERYAERLNRGQRVSFRVAALSNKVFEGTVDFVDPAVQLPGRTILVKALVPNPRRELSPGMFVELELATEIRQEAVVVPEDAVVSMPGATFVWAVKDGKAERRDVRLGVRSPGFVEVRQGVTAGEQVVVGGQERLAPGAPVMPRVVERRPVPTEGTPGATPTDTATPSPASPPPAADSGR